MVSLLSSHAARLKDDPSRTGGEEGGRGGQTEGGRRQSGRSQVEVKAEQDMTKGIGEGDQSTLELVSDVQEDEFVVLQRAEAS